MNWRLALSAMLVIAAIIIGGALWRERAALDNSLEQGRSDYTLYDFELVSLDAQGKEAFTLHAPKLTRDPAVRTLAVVTPVFLIPARDGGNGAPWDVRSKTGWVSAAGDEIRLRGDVVATSVDADGQSVRMDTQQLNVFPHANRATSAVQVSVKQPGLILNGHAMEARLDLQRVSMKDAKARYVPK
ncbi:LPS export ABC transporter periplasmic protein LptC [Cognatilysobacter lacus]|uniref:LPS export ABC transporter periplasmic protein LptC n=1 Tax=Cognatilysobacter lacus TaxID=1643323 RepID=A0A5D8Z9X1_9GAMM|nr:LPS export ABC transporter periplasmic protein LptC [Lysobacter lacus]TZF91601.1 LPS export ABC transporter periplasmic protein LptC [Lysobacter lacus]